MFSLLSQASLAVGESTPPSIFIRPSERTALGHHEVLACRRDDDMLKLLATTYGVVVPSGCCVPAARRAVAR